MEPILAHQVGEQGVYCFPLVYLSQTAEEQRVAQLEARIKEQDAQANAQRCQSLRNNLTNLNVGGRIYEMDASGKRQYLDGREIELKRERVQKAIDQYCGNSAT